MGAAWSALFVAVMAVAVAHAQDGEPPGCPADYALLGLRSLSVAAQARLGATADEALVLGANTGGVHVGRKVEWPAAVVVGRSVDLKSIGVGTRVYCRQRRSTLPIEGCARLTAPAIAAEKLPLVQVLPGGFPVIVDGSGSPGGAFALGPGPYRNVVLAEGRTLKLTGGDYDVGSVTLEPESMLVCSTDCRIRVHGAVRIGRKARVEGERIDDATIARVRLLIEGADTALAAEAESVITAFVYAPTGAIQLGRRGEFTGTFVGSRVRVGRAAFVRSVPRREDTCSSVLGSAP